MKVFVCKINGHTIEITKSMLSFVFWLKNVAGIDVDIINYKKTKVRDEK